MSLAGRKLQVIDTMDLLCVDDPQGLHFLVDILQKQL